MIRKLILPSVLLGGIISLLLMSRVGQPGDYTQTACGRYNPSYVNVRRIDCDDIEYGFPLKFLHPKIMIDVSSLSPSKTSPVFIGGSAISVFSPWNFVADLAIWSAASFAVLALTTTFYQSKKK